MKKTALAILLGISLLGCGGASPDKEIETGKSPIPAAPVKPYLESDISQFQITEPILKDIVKAETEASFVIKQLADAQERYMGIPGKGEYTNNIQKLIDANVLATEGKYDTYQKRATENNTLVLDGGYVVREELIDATPLNNRYRYVATPPERFKGLDVPKFVTSDETRQNMRRHSIPGIEVLDGSFHTEVLDMELNNFFQPKDSSPEERVRQTKENLFLLQTAVDNYKKQNGQFPQGDLRELLYDFRRAEIGKRTLLKHFPQELVSLSKSDILVSAGRQISKDLNATGGWYYNPNSGKVQVNWDKPLGSEWGKFTGQKPSEWTPEDNGKAAIFAFIDFGMETTSTREEKVQLAFYQILHMLKESEKKNGSLSAVDLEPAIQKGIADGVVELKQQLSKMKDPKFNFALRLIKEETKKAYDVLQWLMNLRPDRLDAEEIEKIVREEMKKADPKKEEDLQQVSDNLMCNEALVGKIKWDTLERVVNKVFDEWKAQNKK